MNSPLFYRNQKERRQRMLRKLANARAAKARLRMENPPEYEPKMERWFRLELGLRDKLSGDAAWVDFRSVRDAITRLSVVQKFYA